MPEKLLKLLEADLYWSSHRLNRVLGDLELADSFGRGLSGESACLVSAGCQLVPMPPTPDEDLRRAIARLSGDGSLINTSALRRAYRLVEPALADRARHVFREFLPSIADKMTEECFTASPNERRLAVIHSYISHGGVEPEDLDALAVLEPAEAPASSCVVTP